MTLSVIINIALVIVSLAILGNVYRMLKGPEMPDRILALDAVGMNLLTVAALLSVRARTNVYLDIILLIAFLAFLGTTAFARYLERGVVIEYDPNRQHDR